MSSPASIDHPRQHPLCQPIGWRGWSREVLLSQETGAGLNG